MINYTFERVNGWADERRVNLHDSDEALVYARKYGFDSWHETDATTEFDGPARATAKPASRPGSAFDHMLLDSEGEPSVAAVEKQIEAEFSPRTARGPLSNFGLIDYGVTRTIEVTVPVLARNKFAAILAIKEWDIRALLNVGADVKTVTTAARVRNV